MIKAALGMRAWLAVPAVLIGLLACQRESERPSVHALVGQLEGGRSGSARRVIAATWAGMGPSPPTF